jgi:hypothetical protein
VLDEVIKKLNQKIYILVVKSDDHATNFGSILLGVSMKNTIFFLLVFSFSTLSFANTVMTPEEQNALTISSVEVYRVESTIDTLNFVELPTPTPTPPKPNPTPTPGTGLPPELSQISIIIDTILAIGKKIWPIIEAGRPVINEKFAPAVSIVPHLQNDAGVLLEMENWSTPKVTSMRVSYKNKFGMEVVGFTYNLIFQYNGDFKGVGKYITSLKIIASDINVSWGFDFDAASELVSIANIGTTDAPLASGIINVSYKVKGLFNESRNASTIFVDGSGKVQFLTK